MTSMCLVNLKISSSLYTPLVLPAGNSFDYPKQGLVTGNKRFFCSYEHRPVTDNVRSLVSGTVFVFMDSLFYPNRRCS